ncbi:hypothetical protein AG1IA_00917 [Rhizoctonia solani AG-1 IA]|uniref:Uncharacterized protein n=1 Tax=Thanatephorus cucumeris (strain AG1-IA) TaxID=983506 RepID=L8X4B5_THACA|nr:hypothetical protein AG1IA_00917 [Rhizoctonia solani AG-1 IA]
MNTGFLGSFSSVIRSRDITLTPLNAEASESATTRGAGCIDSNKRLHNAIKYMYIVCGLCTSPAELDFSAATPLINFGSTGKCAREVPESVPGPPEAIGACTDNISGNQ